MEGRKVFLLLLLPFLLIVMTGCAGKISRTFGPITLKAANLHFHQNNVYTLRGSLGFEPYTYEIYYDESGTCWIDEFGRIHVGSYAGEYTLQVKVRDSKGNEGISEYVVNELIVSGPDPIDMSYSSTFQFDLFNAVPDRYGNYRTRWTIVGNSYNAYWYYCGWYGYNPWWNTYDYIYDSYCNQSISFSINAVIYDVNAGSSVTKTINFIP